MTVIASMKKDETKRFVVTAFNDLKVTIKAILEETPEKTRYGKEREIATKTFTRGYEVVQGDVNSLKETITYDDSSYAEDPLPDTFYESLQGATDQEAQAEIAAVTGAPIKIEPYMPENMKSVLDPSREKEDWELAEQKVYNNGWDLIPRNPDPRLNDGSGIIQQEIEINENSMRAGREKENKPFTPKPFFLRQSMISSYLQCPDKFYDTYENGYSEDTIFTRTGTAIHGIMEDFYRNPAEADVPALFEQWWTTHSTAEWSWYRDWKEMVDQYFKRQLTKEQPNVIALEFEFQTGRDGLGEINGVPVSGTIDRIDRVDAKTIKIVDYKTNFQPFTNAQLEESTQFMMYSNVLMEMKHILGDFDTIICEYDMLRLGYTQEITYDAETLETFRGYMAMIWNKMLSGSNRAPQLNQYCGFCQKRATCPLYERQLNAPIAEILTENTALEDVAGEKERLGQVKKMVENRLKEIDEQLRTAISNSGGTELQIGEHIWSSKASTRTSYPTESVFRIMAMHGLADKIPDIVNIGATNMKRVLKDNADVLNAINEASTISYTSPSLTKKKAK